MFQDSVPAGSYNDPFLSSVCVCVCGVCVCVCVCFFFGGFPLSPRFFSPLFVFGLLAVVVVVVVVLVVVVVVVVVVAVAAVVVVVAVVCVGVVVVVAVSDSSRFEPSSKVRALAMGCSWSMVWPKALI